jgi:hypothetical protein
MDVMGTRSRRHRGLSPENHKNHQKKPLPGKGDRKKITKKSE